MAEPSKICDTDTDKTQLSNIKEYAQKEIQEAEHKNTGKNNKQ